MRSREQAQALPRPGVTVPAFNTSENALTFGVHLPFQCCELYLPEAPLAAPPPAHALDKYVSPEGTLFTRSLGVRP